MENQENQTGLRHCQAVTADGRGCRSFAVNEKGWCYIHDPEKAAQRTEARSKGGKHSARASRIDKLMPPRLKPVYALLERSMAEVYKGNLKPATGTALAAIARACVAVLEAGELEERVRDMETKLQDNSEIKKR